MRLTCIFAGTNLGIRPEYKQATHELGQELVARGQGIIYGGASVGLMGTLADAVLEAGGEAIGVLPKGLFQREVAHTRLTKLYTVNTMHERKALMADLAESFIALPGGFGTFDELFEITTWAQIGLHSKPIGLLNVADYFTPLLALVHHAATEGFILPFHTQLLLAEKTPIALLDTLKTRIPAPQEARWTDTPPER